MTVKLASFVKFGQFKTELNCEIGVVIIIFEALDWLGTYFILECDIKIPNYSSSIYLRVF